MQTIEEINKQILQLNEVLQETIELEELIKRTKYKDDYLKIHNRNLNDNIGAYFSLILDINHEIIENKKIFDELKNTLNNLIYSAINYIKKEDEDLIITLENIDWQKYENIAETIGEAAWCRLSYLDGVLELMSPSIHHEELVENSAAIITQYCFEKDIECYGMGSARLKNDNKKGKEPDVSYALYQKKEIPDIAVEVNISSGTIKDLEIYADIGVKEVWIYNPQNKIKFYLPENNNYKERNNSYYFELLTPNIVNEILEIGKEKGITRIKKEVISLLAIK